MCFATIRRLLQRVRRNDSLFSVSAPKNKIKRSARERAINQHAQPSADKSISKFIEPHLHAQRHRERLTITRSRRYPSIQNARWTTTRHARHACTRARRARLSRTCFPHVTCHEFSSLLDQALLVNYALPTHRSRNLDATLPCGCTQHDVTASRIYITEIMISSQACRNPIPPTCVHKLYLLKNKQSIPFSFYISEIKKRREK